MSKTAVTETKTLPGAEREACDWSTLRKEVGGLPGVFAEGTTPRVAKKTGTTTEIVPLKGDDWRIFTADPDQYEERLTSTGNMRPWEALRAETQNVVN